MLSWFTIIRRRPDQAGLRPGQVMLTFDDGPNLEDNVTPDLLDVLHRHNVKAGFCLIGNQIKRHPDIVRRMHYSGHLLINHTTNHIHPTRQSTAELIDEAESCDAELSRALGIPNYRSDYFRAPYGIVTPAVRRMRRRLNFTPVLLTHYSWDTRFGPQNYQEVVDQTLTSARRRNGGLFVLHDGTLGEKTDDEPAWPESPRNRSWVPAAVDEMLTTWKHEGLEVVCFQNKNAQQTRLTGKCA